MFRILAIKFYNWLFPVRNTENVGENTMSDTATIVPTGNGRFALVRRGVGTVNTYARVRDARRGAARLGLVLA